MKITTKPVFNAVKYLYKTNSEQLLLDVSKFYGVRKDMFVASNKVANNIKPVKLKLYSYSNSMNYVTNIDMDLNVPQKIILEKTEIIKDSKAIKDHISVYYNPNTVAQVFEKVFNKATQKIEKKPLDVNIMQSFDGLWETTYYFMRKDLSECIGYVTLGDLKKLAIKNGLKPQKGITVSFLQNFNNNKYAGIGKLADRLEIEYCLKNKIKPVIISEADPGSHIAHYKRGKRFFPLVDDNDAKKFFVDKYKSDNVNAIIAKLLSENDGKW